MVLALLGNEKTLSEIASQNEVHPKNLQNWKTHFLENMACVFDQGKEMKANRDTLKSHQDEIDELHRQNGKINAQLEWAKKKLRSLDLKTREGLIDPSGSLSVREQCTIVSVKRSTFYYEKQAEFSEEDLQILKRMDEIYTQDASYGYRRQRKQLKM